MKSASYGPFILSHFECGQHQKLTISTVVDLCKAVYYINQLVFDTFCLKMITHLTANYTISRRQQLITK